MLPPFLPLQAVLKCLSQTSQKAPEDQAELLEAKADASCVGFLSFSHPSGFSQPFVSVSACGGN